MEKQILERHFRPAEIAERTGLSLATVRKLILRRQLAYRKISRAILVPESEIVRILGRLHSPVSSEESA